MPGLRAALLPRIARALWRRGPALGARAAVVTAVMRRTPTSSRLSRQLDLLGEAISAAGAAALMDDPDAAAAMLAALGRQGAAPVVIVGDSHSRLYAQRDRQGRRWLLPLLHLATGASARGLGRTHSRLGLGAAIRSVAGAAPKLPLLLVFGQVDVEFVFTFKRLASDPPAPRDATAFAAFAEEAASGYAAFAASLPARATLAAIFPPALSDQAWRAGYLNAHIAGAHAELDIAILRERLQRADIADLPQRTAEHALFNRILAAEAATHGLGWLDVWDGLPMAAGAVSPEMLGRAGGRDHHLDAQALRPHLTAKLWRLIDRPPTDGPAPQAA